MQRHFNRVGVWELRRAARWFVVAQYGYLPLEFGQLEPSRIGLLEICHLGGRVFFFLSHSLREFFSFIHLDCQYIPICSAGLPVASRRVLLSIIYMWLCLLELIMPHMKCIRANAGLQLGIFIFKFFVSN